MASENEIDNLVVRLTGDGSEFQRTLQQANENAAKVSKTIEDQGKKIESMGTSLQNYATSLLGTTTLLNIFAHFGGKLGQALQLGFGLALAAFPEYVKDALFTHTDEWTGEKVEGVWDKLLSGVKSGMEKVKEALKTAVIGEEDPFAETESAWTRFTDVLYYSGYTLQLLFTNLGEVIGAVADVVIGVFQPAIDASVALLKEYGVTIASVAASLLALYGIYKTISYTLQILNFLMDLLYVKQILSMAIWVAWKVVVLAAQGVLILFNAQLALWNALMGVGAGVSVLITIKKALWTAATWLLNAALTAMNVLLAPAFILAAVGTVTLLIVAFTAATAAVTGLIGVLASLATAVSAVVVGLVNGLRPVISIFDEWWVMIKTIVTAMDVDMSAAWQLMKAGAEVAFNQLKDNWSAVWDFAWNYLKIGAQATMTYLGAVLTAEFGFIMAKLYDKAQRVGQAIGSIFDPYREALGIASSGDATRDLDNLMRTEEELRRSTLAAAGARLGRDLGSGGSLTVSESDATRGARGAYNDILHRLADVTKPAAEAQKAGTTIGQSLAKGVGTGFKDRLPAALSGSLEALSRSYDYQQSLRQGFGAALTGANPLGRTGTSEQRDQVVPLLMQIRDYARISAGNPTIRTTPTGIR